MTTRGAGATSPEIRGTLGLRQVAVSAGAVGAPHARDRQPARAWLVFSGLAGGALCFLLAELSIPSDAAATELHDLRLTQRLGFLLAPALPLWLGWLQRSWSRALIGGGCGLLAGWLGHLLCSSAFEPILLGLPILLGAVVAAIAATPSDDLLVGLAARLGKGLLVGLVTGVGYIVVLGLAEPAFWPTTGNVDYGSAYVQMMWRAGPLALGLAGVMLLPALVWAGGLALGRTVSRAAGARGLPPSVGHRSVAATSRAAPAMGAE